MSKKADARISIKRKISFSVILFVASCLFILGVGEIVVRVFSPGGYVTPDTMRAASVEYQPAVFARSIYPQRAQQADGGRININDLGYRGKSFTVKKAEGIVRVVCLGGSQVLDSAQKDGEDWPALLEKGLQSKGINAEVINAGVAGNASCDSLGRFYTEIWMLKPDYVVICHAWNDIKYFKNLNPEKSLLRSIYPPQFIRQDGHQLIWNPYIYYCGKTDKFMCHSQLYVRLRNRYWSLKLGHIGFEGLITGNLKTRNNVLGIAGDDVPVEWSNKWAIKQYSLNMRLIVNAVKAVGAKPILLTQPRLPASDSGIVERKSIMYEYVGLSHEELVTAFEECDQALSDIAKEENIKLIDTKDILTGKHVMFRDHVHLTATGSSVLSKLVAQEWK